MGLISQDFRLHLLAHWKHYKNQLDIMILRDMFEKFDDVHLLFFASRIRKIHRGESLYLNALGFLQR